ncbi:MAG: adenylate/guanylate cyclase domain-containing protein [Acidobacteria bacterium]|nr:adenylate/guanylate cyclase domain-containing protein [Acidobacteriota bacterium]
MAVKEDVIAGVDAFFNSTYTTTKGLVIPNVGDIGLSTEGRELEVSMLFIDIRRSTTIVDAFRRKTAAKMYQSFLLGVSKIARGNLGELRSFNGDGVLVVFAGNNKETRAVKTALQLSWFGVHVLRPKLQSYFAKNQQLANLEFDFGIGVDTGTVLVVRGGIRGENNNDLVWVGNAANYAAKLSGLRDENCHSFISPATYNAMDSCVKTSGDGQAMWESCRWNEETVYRGNWLAAPPYPLMKLPVPVRPKLQLTAVRPPSPAILPVRAATPPPAASLAALFRTTGAPARRPPLSPPPSLAALFAANAPVRRSFLPSPPQSTQECSPDLMSVLMDYYKDK